MIENLRPVRIGRKLPVITRNLPVPFPLQTWRFPKFDREAGTRKAS
jgi:hypothetical protein